MSKYVLDSEWGRKYPNFSKSEFKCPCGECDGYGVGIAASLVTTLQELRNSKGKAIVISSGYRCPPFNSKIGGIQGSKHEQGRAADFYFKDGSLANQDLRINQVNELKKTKYYNYSYCNINGNYPDMGSAIHLDTKLVDLDTNIIVRNLQHALNVSYNLNLVEDNIYGSATKNACKKHYLMLRNWYTKNDHVKWLQQRLKDLGYQIEVDSYYGPKTKAIVIEFQKKNNLIQDGIVGIDTHTKLVS